MADLQSVHTQARKLILTITSSLAKLESSDPTGWQASSDGLLRESENQFDQLQRLAQTLESQWRMQSLAEAPGRREVWRRKVEAVVEEAASLGQALRRLEVARRRHGVDAAARDELLGGGAVLQREHTDSQARASFANSKRILEEAFQAGAASLAGMASQRETLKAAQRRALDVVNSLGLSDSLLRLADRRHRMDKVFAYGGMLLTLFLVVLLYWWLKM